MCHGDYNLSTVSSDPEDGITFLFNSGAISMKKLSFRKSLLVERIAGKIANCTRRVSSYLKAGMFSIGLLAMALTSSVATAAEPVNINLASAEVLAEALQGVGEAKALRIIEYREAHGPFEHIEELAAVRGIGLDTVEKNRDVIRLQ
jgi:competence protein ComEA